VCVLTCPLSSWQTVRRFREFDALHEALCDKYGHIVPDKLPSKGFFFTFQNFEPSFLHKRQQKLDKYMVALMSRPALAQSNLLRAFVMPSHDGDDFSNVIASLNTFSA